MGFAQRFAVAFRYTFNRRGSYLSGFLSRLSMLGIVMAIGLLIIVLSVMNGFDREMRENILSLVPQLSLKSWQSLADWEGDLKRIEGSPRVRGVAPYVQLQAMLTHGGNIETTLANGVSLRHEANVGGLYRLLGATELSRFSQDANGLLLGIELARNLGAGVGDSVTLIVPSQDGRAKFEYLRIAGLLSTGTEWDQSAAIMRLALASDLAGLSGGIHGFRVVVDDIFEAGRIGWQLVNALPPGYYASDWTMTHGNLYTAIQLSRDLIGVLLLSIIATAAFNVVSSLVLVVIDKQSDIAILRAMGATPGNIRSLFLLQGLLIATIGITMGSGVGLLGSAWSGEIVALIETLLDVQFLTTDIYPIDYIPADVRLFDVLAIAGITALMCFFAALYPAHRAAKFLPAEVLRHE